MTGRAVLARVAVLLLAEFCILGGHIGPAAAAPPAQAVAAPAGDERQILVMLRLAPDHHRPGPSYDGDYGDQTSAATRQRLARKIARRQGLEIIGDGWPMATLGVDCYVMRVPEGETLESALQRISGDPNIVWSQPMHAFQAPEDGPTRR